MSNKNSGEARGVVFNKFGDTVSLYYQGKQRLYTNDKPEYQRVQEAVLNFKGEEQAAKLLELFKEFTQPKAEPQAENIPYTVNDRGEVVVNGQVLPSVLGRRLLQHKQEGVPLEPILNYWNKLVKTPSFRVVQHQYDHLERHHHPLLPDGSVLAWKRVRDDFKDFYTGTFDNSVGSTPNMPRNEVDENPDHTCSKGLHLANFLYARDLYQSGRGKLIEVSVDPADIVAIPKSYDGKMRVCKYTVLAVCEEEDKSLVAKHEGRTGFAVDPDDSVTCKDCQNHIDYCECHLDDYCDDCNELFDDCTCEDENDDDLDDEIY